MAATGPSGVSATTSAIQAFLQGAGAVDNYVLASLTSNAPAVFPLGATVVTFTATDAASNVGTATATVTVTDQAKPVVTPPADTTVAATDAAGILSSDAAVQAFLAAAQATDDVGVVSLTDDVPALLPPGDTVITFTATDAASNVGTATATITVTPFQASGGGGGCALRGDRQPTAPLLLVLFLGVLWHRRRPRGAGSNATGAKAVSAR